MSVVAAAASCLENAPWRAEPEKIRMLVIWSILTRGQIARIEQVG
jgi:hypothetical protein